MISTPGHLSNPVTFQAPDCVSCLRKKLDALGVASFFFKDDAWVLSDFEDTVPGADAEFRFHYLIRINAPGIIAGSEKGIICPDETSIRMTIAGVNHLFDGCTLIGAATVFEGLGGVRIAWRDSRNPFSHTDLETLQCFGHCPEGCGVA